MRWARLKKRGSIRFLFCKTFEWRTSTKDRFYGVGAAGAGAFWAKAGAGAAAGSV